MSEAKGGKKALEEESAQRDVEFERRVTEDDPTGFVTHKRPPKGPSQVYSVRIPVSALKALREIAERKQMQPSQLMRAWVLERLETETAGRELRISRDELAEVVRTEVDAAFREHRDVA